MIEQGKPLPNPQELLRIKDELMSLWEQLPPEHQATMSLVLIDRVMQTEMSEWLKVAITIKWSVNEVVEQQWKFIPISWVGKQDLLNCRPDLTEQIETLSDAEVEHIGEKIGDALQETYKLAMGIVLADYFGVQTPNANEQSEESACVRTGTT